MKALIFSLVLAVSCAEEMLITREYTEYLKSHVDWEVMEYEDNPFKGWTLEDAKSLYNQGTSMRRLRHSSIPEVEPLDNLPSHVDWSDRECDQGTRNQGPCAAGWAFAVAGMLSERCCLHSRYRGWLSPQELVSCDKANRGCKGGDPESAMNYIMRNKGLVSEYCFSYESKEVPCPKACRSGDNWMGAHRCSCAGGVKKCTGLASIKTCLTTGPVTLTFSVCKSIEYYKMGIYKCDCDPEYTGTMTGLAMGYSEKPSCNVRIRMSMGMTWGNMGYINIDCSSCEIDSEDNVNVMCEKVTKSPS